MHIIKYVFDNMAILDIIRQFLTETKIKKKKEKNISLQKERKSYQNLHLDAPFIIWKYKQVLINN